MNVTRYQVKRKLIVAIPAALLLLTPIWLAPQGQENPTTAVPQADTCVIDPDGTAHITRVIPVPKTISPEAQKFISMPARPGPDPTLAQRRSGTDLFRIGRAKEAQQLFPV